MTSPALDVVTGGAGFIGSHLVDALIARGRAVRVIDNFVSGHPRNLAHHEGASLLEVRQVDIRDRAAMVAAIAGAERVFHLAALADIVPLMERPEDYVEVNVNGTFNTLQAARAAGVSRFVYAASSSCYGIPDVFPTAESAPLRPQYPYALTKRLGEELVEHWGQVYGLSVVSLRLFNAYGPRTRTSGAYGAVFGVFLAQLLAGKPLTIVGDGEQTRDFTFVTDIAAALIAAADSGVRGECFNVGSGASVSINRIAALLSAADIVHIPKRPGEPDCTFADIDKIATTIGWRPQVGIEAGVRVLLDNIEYWRDAPVWTPESIAEATRVWFAHLADS